MKQPNFYPPADCELCVPVEIQHGTSGVVTYAHESGCVNHPVNLRSIQEVAGAGNHARGGIDA